MENNKLRKTARLISTIFVPPSFTLIIFTFLTFYLETELTKKIILLSVTLTFGFLFHIFLFFYLMKKGKIADHDATIKEERTFPFIIATGFYIIGLIILYFFEINSVSLSFWFCYISNTLIIIFINKYWKISIHALGAAGPLGLIFYLFGSSVLFFLPLVILIGWTRIYLKCHTPMQVAGGLLFGFFSTYFQVGYLLKIFY